MELGYPGKLRGEEIPYLARLTSVVDSFDAMTSRRAYRNSFDLEFVKSELKKNIGTQFDPVFCKAFLEILENEPEKIQEIRDKFNGN